MKSTAVFRTILVWGGLLTLAIAVLASGIGFLVDGTNGLVSALVGTLMSAVFLGITGASILFANRFYGRDMYVPIFFGVVMGGWIVKFIVFLVLVVVLKEQTTLNTTVLFLSILASVIGGLVIDVVVIARSRIPYVSDAKEPSTHSHSD
ncbi:fructose-specific phosphotransferase system IIC component [Mycetocola sp. CAN_C7]|uniref:hypothetical protein n=1 Tax=Mycetocola sp. CAN_C7 TaxID=2787724 RepID=UPI0018CA2285